MFVGKMLFGLVQLFRMGDFEPQILRFFEDDLNQTGVSRVI